nr:hypothetical protein B0A51_11375 [Rachicladosporium sp. CCFEE 5018]
MKKTLLLVFVHGFKGSDDTFGPFPQDLRALISTTLPKLDVLSIQYPRYETRGDLKECVSRFKEWLQNKVIDLEVANGTPSPTVDPSVHVVLVGHSMGGIVAAETLLSIARDEPVPASASSTSKARNGTESASGRQSPVGGLKAPNSDKAGRSSSAPPSTATPTSLFFPYIDGVLAFDTPYLGISPGVLAHGAEEQIKHASKAYKAYNGASELFGWGNAAKATPQPIANASSRGLPAPSSNGTNWGKWAMYGGAAAAIAGAAGAAYMSWNSINQGLTWAGSHLEFVGCLARGAELQTRVEQVVDLTQTHGVGFCNFYGALGEKITSKTQYAGAVVGQDRTFCVVPKQSALADSPTGSKRSAKTAGNDDSSTKPPRKKRKPQNEKEMQQEMEQEGEDVREFAKDPTKRKGEWVKCINEMATDELKAHTSMFAAKRNPGYFAMLPLARDRVVSWVDEGWYGVAEGDGKAPVHEDADTSHESDGRDQHTQKQREAEMT